MIETGKCKIVNRTTKKKTFFCEIGRGICFGESSVLKTPSIEYFGDVVAVGNDGKPVVHEDDEYFESSDLSDDVDRNESGPSTTVQCLFLGKEDLRRVPQHELEDILKGQKEHYSPYQFIAARKFKVPVE